MCPCEQKTITMYQRHRGSQQPDLIVHRPDEIEVWSFRSTREMQYLAGAFEPDFPLPTIRSVK